MANLSTLRLPVESVVPRSIAATDEIVREVIAIMINRDYRQEEVEKFLFALALNFGQLTALIDSDTSLWGGRTRVEDRLFDRYSSVATTLFPFEVRTRLAAPKPIGPKVWELSVDRIPHNPDDRSWLVCSFRLAVAGDDSIWQLLKLIGRLLDGSFLRAK